MAEPRRLFADKVEEKPTATPTTGQGEPEEVDVGPCASVPRGKWVMALEIRHAAKPWEAFQYKDIATRSEFEPTRFTVVFEGRDERYRIVIRGRNLATIYAHCLQHRLEWIEPAVKDFAQDGEPIITSAEVTAEPLKG